MMSPTTRMGADGAGRLAIGLRDYLPGADFDRVGWRRVVACGLIRRSIWRKRRPEPAGSSMRAVLQFAIAEPDRFRIRSHRPESRSPRAARRSWRCRHAGEGLRSRLVAWNEKPRARGHEMFRRHAIGHPREVELRRFRADAERNRDEKQNDTARPTTPDGQVLDHLESCATASVDATPSVSQKG